MLVYQRVAWLWFPSIRMKTRAVMKKVSPVHQDSARANYVVCLCQAQSLYKAPAGGWQDADDKNILKN